MSDVVVQATDGAVTVNLGTTGAISGAANLTTLNRLTKVVGTGEVGLSLILESTIVGALTISKTGTTAREATFPDAAITVAGTDLAQTWTAAQTFRAASAVRSEAAATQDAVVLAGRAGGTGSYAAILTPAALSASVTLTLPALTGTLATIDNAQTWTAAQTFGSGIATDTIAEKTAAAGVTADGVLLKDGSVIAALAGALLIGPDATDGSWRFVISGADLLIQKYITSAWVTKTTVSGA